MELQFLGRGGGLLPEEGNTSAYFIEDGALFLIDCGELIFSKIKQTGLLEKAQIEEIFCFITHLHSDHVGSLSNLIYYCTFGQKDKKIGFHLVCEDIIAKDLLPWLYLQGNTSLFDSVATADLEGKYQSFTSVRFIRTAHSGFFPAFSVEFETDAGKVFYSGDTNEIYLIECYVRQPGIDKMYIEVALDENVRNVHLMLESLNEIIPKKLRGKVYLMHFDCIECITEAKKLGFQVVECK
jgi:ribonuclease BN (tRNA processing enzyme)